MTKEVAIFIIALLKHIIPIIKIGNKTNIKKTEKDNNFAAGNSVQCIRPAAKAGSGEFVPE